MEGAEEMTVPGSTAVPVGLRPATHLEMRCVLGESVILQGGVLGGLENRQAIDLAGGSS